MWSPTIFRSKFFTVTSTTLRAREALNPYKSTLLSPRRRLMSKGGFPADLHSSRPLHAYCLLPRPRLRHSSQRPVMRVRKVTWKAVVQVGLDLANNFGVFICIEHHDPNKMEVPGRRVPAEYIFLSLTPDEKVFRRLIAARHAEECNGLREGHAWPITRNRPRTACGRSGPKSGRCSTRCITFDYSNTSNIYCISTCLY